MSDNPFTVYGEPMPSMADLRAKRPDVDRVVCALEHGPGRLCLGTDPHMTAAIVYDSGVIGFDASGRLTDSTGAETTFDG